MKELVVFWTLQIITLTNMTRTISQEHFKERAKSREFGMILRKWNFVPNMTQHQRINLSAIHFILCPIL